jgi:diphthamide synthase subunit DPH2
MGSPTTIISHLETLQSELQPGLISSTKPKTKATTIFVEKFRRKAMGQASKKQQAKLKAEKEKEKRLNLETEAEAMRKAEEARLRLEEAGNAKRIAAEVEAKRKAEEDQVTRGKG